MSFFGKYKGGDNMKTNTKTDKNILKTTKKQKFVGSTEVVDLSTGERIPMQLVEVEDRDFNFHKVWLQNLIMSLDGISNQRLKLAFWILDHLDKENQLVMTQRKIAEKSGMSLSTVMHTMKALQTGNPAFLQKINSGAYRVNPDVIWKGSFSNRMGVCITYHNQTAENTRNAQKGPQNGPGAQQDTQDTPDTHESQQEPPEGYFEADFRDEIPQGDIPDVAEEEPRPEGAA